MTQETTSSPEELIDILDSLTSNQEIFLILHTLLVIVICVKLGVHMHRLQDKVPTTKLRNTIADWSFGIGLGFIVCFSGLVYFQKSTDNLLNDEMISLALDLVLGLIITIAGFFIPERANTYKPSYQRIGIKQLSFPKPRIEVAGCAAGILVFGGYLNTFILLLADGDHSYINLLAQAVFLSSTIIAIGGDTVETHTDPITKRKRYNLTPMGQIAVIVLLAGLSVKMVDEYNDSKSNSESFETLSKTKEEAVKANKSLSNTIGKLDNLETNIDSAIEDVNSTIGILQNALDVNVVENQTDLLGRIPVTFSTDFEAIKDSFNMEYFNHISSSFEILNTKLNFDFKGRIDTFEMAARDTVHKNMIKAMKGYQISDLAFKELIKEFEEKIKGDDFEFNGQEYYAKSYADTIINQLTRRVDSLEKQTIGAVLENALTRDASGSFDTLVVIVRRE